MRKYEKMIGRRTLGRMTMKLTHRVKGHSLLHLLAPLTHLLASASRAPLRSFARSLARSLAPELMGMRILSMK